MGSGDVGLTKSGPDDWFSAEDLSVGNGGRASDNSIAPDDLIDDSQDQYTNEGYRWSFCYIRAISCSYIVMLNVSIHSILFVFIIYKGGTVETL